MNKPPPPPPQKKKKKQNKQTPTSAKQYYLYTKQDMGLWGVELQNSLSKVKYMYKNCCKTKEQCIHVKNAISVLTYPKLIEIWPLPSSQPHHKTPRPEGRR